MEDLNGLANKMADRFFKERDKELLEKLKQEVVGKDSRDALAAASGIEDPTVLDSLIASGIAPDTIASVSLIPLVAVAWSDSKMEAKEREAILKAASEAGIATGSASHQVPEKWLDEQPDDQLLASWTEYVGAMKSELDDLALGQLKTSIISRAQTVAKSAGGYLGLGNKISASEEGVLKTLESSFA